MFLRCEQRDYSNDPSAWTEGHSANQQLYLQKEFLLWLLLLLPPFADSASAFSFYRHDVWVPDTAQNAF